MEIIYLAVVFLTFSLLKIKLECVSIMSFSLWQFIFVEKVFEFTSTTRCFCFDFLFIIAWIIVENMFLLLSKAMHACILFERYFKDLVDDILKQRMVTITYGWIFNLFLCSLTLKGKRKRQEQKLKMWIWSMGHFRFMLDYKPHK